MVKGCEGVLQIKDDILVYGREEEHDQRLHHGGQVLDRLVDLVVVGRNGRGRL